MAENETPQVAPVEKFGDIFRREREARGVTLAEIAEATKISKRFLGAIEGDDFATLPAPVFTRGFIRQYAKYLGLDSDQLLYEYGVFLVSTQSDQPQPLSSAGHVEAKGIPPPYTRVNRNFLKIVAILVPLIAIAVWARYHFVTNAPAPVVPAPAAVAPVIPVTQSAVAQPQPAAPPAAELTLTVHAKEETWIKLEADGKPVFDGSLQSGATKSFTATDRFVFHTIGNAGGVTVTLDGHELPPLGEPGQVLRDKVFDRQTLSAGSPGTL